MNYVSCASCPPSGLLRTLVSSVTSPKAIILGNNAVVVEFRYHGPTSSWVPVAVREDKVQPNHLHVAWNSLELAAEHLTLRQMLDDLKTGDGLSMGEEEGEKKEQSSRKRMRIDSAVSSRSEDDDALSPLASSVVPSSDEDDEM